MTDNIVELTVRVKQIFEWEQKTKTPELVVVKDVYTIQRVTEKNYITATSTGSRKVLPLTIMDDNNRKSITVNKDSYTLMPYYRVSCWCWESEVEEMLPSLLDNFQDILTKCGTELYALWKAFNEFPHKKEGAGK